MRKARWGFWLGFGVGCMLGVRWVARRGLRITPPWLAPLLTSRLRHVYRTPERLVALLNPQPSWCVLDLGCGNGAYTLPIAAQGCNVLAVDVQRAMLRALQQRLPRALSTSTHLCQASAERLPFRHAAFDAVVMIAVLPMTPRPAQVLREVRRVLKPGGVLVVSEEVFAPEYVPPSKTQRWLESAGFRVTRLERALLQYTVRSVAP